ncbi:MAG: hypothetical protein PHX20_01680 [Candidatus Omnitrophica bacterium]|nr:hypothetical protein [Candidatus Omnitrophota bacterium]MDD5436233.1 hypothetical protein [Candidatus Omnitrophota bacterium]
MRRCKKGILLLEVMVAIVVITGGLLFVMRVYSTAKEALYRSRDLFKYSLLLEEKMYDFEERCKIEDGREHDHFPDLREYQWETVAEPLAPEGQVLCDLCSLKLDVFYKSGSSSAGQSDKYYLFTYIPRKK